MSCTQVEVCSVEQHMPAPHAYHPHAKHTKHTKHQFPHSNPFTSASRSSSSNESSGGGLITRSACIEFFQNRMRSMETDTWRNHTHSAHDQRKRALERTCTCGMGCTCTPVHGFLSAALMITIVATICLVHSRHSLNSLLCWRVTSVRIARITHNTESDKKRDISSSTHDR